MTGRGPDEWRAGRGARSGDGPAPRTPPGAAAWTDATGRPAGYERARLEGGTVVHVWAPARAAILAALSSEPLHAWALGRPGMERLGGRGEARAFDAPAAGPEGRSRWVVRHYVRGGAVAAWLGDRYLAVGRRRPLAEFRTSDQARRRGVPTPAVVAAAVYPAGWCYRGDLVTEMVPGAVDLATALFGAPGPAGMPERAGAEGRADALEAAGSLVRLVARVGLAHPDVNATNIVLAREPADGRSDLSSRAWLLDLDRCRLLPGGRAADAAPMLRRLERSLDKLGARAGAPLGPRELARLRHAAEEGP